MTTRTRDFLRTFAGLFALASMVLVAWGKLAYAGWVLMLVTALRATERAELTRAWFQMRAGRVVFERREQTSFDGPFAGADLSWRLAERYGDAAPLLGIAVFYRNSPWAMAIALAAVLGAVMDAYARASAAAYGLVLRAALAPTLLHLLLATSLLFGTRIRSATWANGLGVRFSVNYPVTLGLVALAALVLNAGAVVLTRVVRQNLRLLAE